MEKNNTKPSMAVIRRLPKYRRQLKILIDKNIERISSNEISTLTGFTASQIRQDLNTFGGFGQQGYGYKVLDLYEAIENILGLDRVYNTIIVGAGNLGQAIANYTTFEEKGFKLKAMFDINPKLIGLSIRDVKVLDVDEMTSFVEKNQIDIGIICTDRSNAQKIAEIMVNSGINGIWNFAATDLELPANINVENVNLSESLYTLSYLLNNSN